MPSFSVSLSLGRSYSSPHTYMPIQSISISRHQYNSYFRFHCNLCCSSVRECMTASRIFKSYKTKTSENNERQAYSTQEESQNSRKKGKSVSNNAHGLQQNALTIKTENGKMNERAIAK